VGLQPTFFPLLLILVLAQGTASAALIGTSLTVQERAENCHSCTPQSGILGSAVVQVQEHAIELTDFANFQVDVSALSIELTANRFIGVRIVYGDFYGLDFLDLELPAGAFVAGVHPSTNIESLDPSRVSYGPSSVSVDWSGLPYGVPIPTFSGVVQNYEPAFLRLDLVVVPEPNSFLLLLFGLGLLGRRGPTYRFPRHAA